MAQQKNAVAKGRYLAADELSIFSEQIALILSSGVPLYDGVEALCENYHDTPLAPAFSALDSAVKRLGKLAQALEEAKIFPPYMIRMANIGEETGKLDEVMAQLSTYYAREARIKRSVRNAITYPLCLIAMMAVVILVLVIKVLPIFNQVYRSLGKAVSGTASALMDFGMQVGMFVLVLAGIATLLALVAAVLMRTGKRQAVLDAIGKVLPPVRRLAACLTAGRFAANLGMMLSSGYPLEEALSLIQDVMEDPKGREKVAVCRQRMGDGQHFPDAIASVDLFEPLHNKMVQIGFKTGQTDKVMAKLADIYQEQMDDDISSLIALIEPSMVVVLSVIIGAILLSVMLPMVSIMSSIL